MNEQMFELLKKLTNTNGVSGDETRVREIIVSEAKKNCDNVEIDNMGNVIAKKPRNGAKKMLICAHMDEVGFIISGITAEGYLKFKSVGGIDADILSAKQVVIGNSHVPGVIAARPKHLIKNEKSAKTKIDDLFIDIGAESKTEAEKHISIGDYACFTTKYEEFGNGCVKAKALDDRVGCAIMLELLKHDFPYDIEYIWTVQEEVGCRGALALMKTADLAIVIEGTTCSDLPKTPGDKVSTRLGEGVALSIMDPSCIYDKTATKSMYDYGKNNSIKVQYKTTFTGGNDSSKIHLKSGGIRTVAANIPCRYIHSPATVASKSDIESGFSLMKGWINNGDF